MFSETQAALLRAQEVAVQNGYDLDATYKKCGQRIQQLFGISAAEFQAARHQGDRENLREVLTWIFDERQKRNGQSKSNGDAQGPDKPAAAADQSVALAALDREIMVLATRLASKLAERNSLVAV